MKLMVKRDSDFGKKKGGRAGKQRQLGRGTDEYLEEETPVEIIEERKQRLHMSRMDTRLRTPTPRIKKGWAGGKIKTTSDREKQQRRRKN